MPPANKENLPEVLREQLDYLMLHYSTHTGARECEECIRFKQVENLLLVPFRFKEYRHKRKILKSKV